MMNETAPAPVDPAYQSTAAEHDAVDHDAPVPPGRPIRLEPTPPGLWRVILGVVVALLAPFFGIIIGSGMGSTDSAGRMAPLYWGFFIGGLIGGAALVVAGLGAMALLRHSRAAEREADGTEQP